MSMALMPGANAAFYFRNGVVSATSWAVWNGVAGPQAGLGPSFGGGKVSADARICLKGIVMTGEVAWDIGSGRIAACLGSDIPIRGYWRTALSLRYIPDGYDLLYSSPVRTFSGKYGESGITAGDCCSAALSASVRHLRSAAGPRRGCVLSRRVSGWG